MKNAFMISLAAATLASCGSNTTADTDAADDTAVTADAMSEAESATEMVPGETGDMMPTDAAGYAAMAGASDKFEIDSSKALLAKSNNADLKKFAQMMVDNHSQSTEKVKAAAKTANIKLSPPMLDAMQQKMLEEIKAADAVSIDLVYMNHQRTAHQSALALHQGYAAKGDNDAFKKTASEIVPVVQNHIAELGKMPAA